MKRRMLLDFTDWFEKNRRKYDQASIFDCIGAHAQAWKTGTPRGVSIFGGSHDLMELFDLTEDQAMELYYPSEYQYRLIKRRHAVDTLRRLAKTGKVKWKIEEAA